MFMQDWDSGSHGFWLDSGTPWAFSFLYVFSLVTKKCEKG